MNFDLDQEHELVRSTVREFAQQRVAPMAEDLDRESRFPYELVGELAELGLMGMTIPEEYGGAGADTVSYASAVVRCKLRERAGRAAWPRSSDSTMTFFQSCWRVPQRTASSESPTGILRARWC